ncbi:MAG: HEAT repeat domain-containing protein, partial [Bdellovibrionales bacterium]
FLIRKAADSKAPLKLRWRAVTTMGKLDPEGFRGPLDAALTSPEWFMRNAALIALKHGDRERALTWSTRLLRDPALLVRTQAVRNLIDLDAREAEPILWQQLYDKRNFRKGESLWIRRHLAEAVARFAMAGRARNFERLLRDSDTRLHKWAILGLENVTGLRMSDRKEPVEIRRQKWLARLGEQEI